MPEETTEGQELIDNRFGQELLSTMFTDSFQSLHHLDNVVLLD